MTCFLYCIITIAASLFIGYWWRRWSGKEEKCWRSAIVSAFNKGKVAGRREAEKEHLTQLIMDAQKGKKEEK